MPQIMSFLPSAVIESRFSDIENPVHKIYAYLFKADGRITDTVDKGKSFLIEISVPFKFGDKTSDVEIYIDLLK